MRSDRYWSIARGRPDEPSPPVRLSAGSASLLLDGGDIRYYSVGGVELLRRVYVAVRNVVWETLPSVVDRVQVDEGEGGVTARYVAHVVDDEISFAWSGTVKLSASGELSYSMAGEAGSTFDYARIGLNVLHPPWLEGHAYRLGTAAGVGEGSFPLGIGPQPFSEGEYHPLLPAFSSLDVDLENGAVAEFRFTGDEFENEDQRNWSDASYKSYSTPMSRGLLQAEPGSSITQAVHVRLRDGASPARASTTAATGDGPIVVTSRPDAGGGTVPQFGLGWAPSSGALNAAEIDVLRSLGLSHLRVDARLARASSIAAVASADAAAVACGCGLELAAFVTETDTSELDRLAAIVSSLQAPLRRVLAFSERELVSSAGTVAAVRGAVAGAAPVFGGTNLYFAEINRDRPAAGSADGFSFSVNPQVHMSDDRSMTETPASLLDMLRSARLFLGDRPVVVSPVTLLPRFNPDVPGAGTASDGDAPVDGREASALCAVFAALAVKHLAAGGAEAVTMFEAVGERGVLARATAPVHLGGLDAPPGAAFPVADLFSVLGRWSGRGALALDSSAPLSVQALGCVLGGRTEILLANATAEEQAVELRVAGGESATVATLDAESIGAAWEREPPASAWSDAVGPPPDGVLDLAPYGLALVAW